MDVTETKAKICIKGRNYCERNSCERKDCGIKDRGVNHSKKLLHLLKKKKNHTKNHIKNHKNRKDLVQIFLVLYPSLKIANLLKNSQSFLPHFLARCSNSQAFLPQFVEKLTQFADFKQDMSKEANQTIFSLFFEVSNDYVIEKHYIMEFNHLSLQKHHRIISDILLIQSASKIMSFSIR